MPLTFRLSVIVVMLLAPDGDAAAPKTPEARTVRIGVYVRDGFDSCLEDWLPTAERLSRAIQGFDFVIVPLASREDIYDHLQEEKLDFLLTNAAVYVCAEERFGVSALAGMTSRADPTGRSSTGSLIRRADRTDLAQVQDLVGARFAAVKPWSFSGWIMQRRELQSRGLDPLRNATAVEFEGTHRDVIQSVLDGTTDVGAVATGMLEEHIESGLLDPKDLSVFDREGNSVPSGRKPAPFTKGYPDWVFAKAAPTSEALAKRVLRFLLFDNGDRGPETARFDVARTVPQSYETVRRTLRESVGSDYAYADGLTPKANPNISRAAFATLIGGSIVLAALLFWAWRRARWRDLRDREDIQTIRAELNEVRADKHLLETILTKVRCGIDIVDENNNVVYVAPAIEQRYGAWHGKKCHEYYGNSPVPCEHCTKRAASEARKDDDSLANSCRVTLQMDSHPIGEPAPEEGFGKLLQVPFFDETGRWLYARVHLPPEAFEAETEVEKVAATTR